jgi:hypothetical protein
VISPRPVTKIFSSVSLEVSLILHLCALPGIIQEPEARTRVNINNNNINNPRAVELEATSENKEDVETSHVVQEVTEMLLEEEEEEGIIQLTSI